MDPLPANISMAKTTKVSNQQSHGHKQKIIKTKKLNYAKCKVLYITINNQHQQKKLCQMALSAIKIKFYFILHILYEKLTERTHAELHQFLMERVSTPLLCCFQILNQGYTAKSKY